MSKHNWAVILAGGKGSRFWPLSTPSRPKQLLALCTERSMLVESVLRVGGTLVPMEQVLVVTGPDLADQVRALVDPLGARVLVEPTPKSTGPCIAWAARWIDQRDPDGVMCVFPADHLISDVETFRSVAARAVESASRTNRIVTLGIQPDRPATGFGYIQRHREFSPGVFEVARFVEKPSLSTAQDYVNSGEYSWNAGMFFMRTSIFLDAVSRHKPTWYTALNGLTADGDEAMVATFFNAVESQSVDVAIMEPEGSSLLVIPVDCGWCDLGAWSALSSFNNDGTNFINGDVRLIDVERSVIVSEGARVTVLGLDGICVAVTEGEVLVADLARDQDIRFLSESPGKDA